MSEQTKTNLPPNPFFERQYVSSMSQGRAYLSISAPGGKIAPQDAADLLDWLELIARQLRRDAQKKEPASPAPPPSEVQK